MPWAFLCTDCNISVFLQAIFMVKPKMTNPNKDCSKYHIIIYIEKIQGSFLSRLQISKYNAILKTFYKISQLDTFLLSFDFPLMGCPWPTCNALIVTGFKLLSIPNLDKVREQLT